MESNSRFDQLLSKISDSLNEQQWFQELKSKWEEIDPQSRMYLKLGGAIGAALLVIVVGASFVWSVHSLKTELNEKGDLLALINNANDELRRLKETSSVLSSSTTNVGGAGENWPAYLSGMAEPSGIPKEGVTVSEEKKGTATPQTKESLFDISVKHVNIRQVVRYVLSLESGGRPVKLRNLLIDTKEDPSGYLDATLSISAFSLVTK